MPTRKTNAGNFQATKSGMWVVELGNLAKSFDTESAMVGKKKEERLAENLTPRSLLATKSGQSSGIRARATSTAWLIFAVGSRRTKNTTLFARF